MRNLIRDSARITDGLYRRFVRRAQVEGLLADHLVRGEPYLALDALVLGRGDFDELRALTETFSRAFDRAGRILAADVPGLVEIGFPWAAAEILSGASPRVSLLGRFDFVRDSHGCWQLLEFNADTPSGVREAIVGEAALVRVLPEARALERPSAGLGEALIRAFCEATERLPPGAALGLVTDAGELEDLAQMAFTQKLLEAPLRKQGTPVVLGDVDNLRAGTDGLLLGGHMVGALYRYVPFEQGFGTPPFAAIFDAAAAGRLRLLNGLYGLLLQNKSLLAWLWQHRDDPSFPADEREAVLRHLPSTWRIVDLPSRAGDPSVVVKQVFGREGEEVVFGDALDADGWHARRLRRTYVVQERVPIVPVEAVIPTSAGPRLEEGLATVGAFAVNGTWAGFYTRFGGKIITSRAKWLATLVQPV